MVTNFGKFLRKLRIDEDESAEEMASKLGVTKSYLSLVETGKRTVPKKWIDLITKNYELSTFQLKELYLLANFYDLSEREKKALEEAMTVLYLGDNSDYVNGLWGVIKAVLGNDLVENEGFELEEWLNLMKTFD